MTNDPMDEEYLHTLPDQPPAEEWNRNMRWRFQEILPRLFLGPLSMRKSVEELIHQAAITDILCVLNTHESALYKPKLDRICGGRVSTEVITFDSADNLHTRLIYGNAYIDSALRRGGRVAVCCGDGLVNGPSFLTAYIMATYNCDYEKAFNVVLIRRGCITPLETQLMAFQRNHIMETDPPIHIVRSQKRPDPPCDAGELMSPKVKRRAVNDGSMAPFCL